MESGTIRRPRVFVGDVECVPLHKAVRPGVARDELGTVGESLWSLADAIASRYHEVLVPKAATSAELWQAVNAYLTNLPTAEEELWRDRYRLALARLEECANATTE